jgi:hypothetical protein
MPLGLYFAFTHDIRVVQTRYKCGEYIKNIHQLNFSLLLLLLLLSLFGFFGDTDDFIKAISRGLVYTHEYTQLQTLLTND